MAHVIRRSDFAVGVCPPVSLPLGTNSPCIREAVGVSPSEVRWVEGGGDSGGGRGDARVAWDGEADWMEAKRRNALVEGG